jgi:predicted nucleic acid-binding protein
VIVYAESSAVLAWLLGEPSANATRRILTAAERVVSSSLTAVECVRGLARARDLGRHSAVEELAALRLLEKAEAAWDVHDLSDTVLVRARARFPGEPVRTLDALHLATVMELKAALGQLALLSYDERLRTSAAALGIDVLSADS